ncbi:HCNGP-like protein-domain-containing protein [Bisporella sp. PMI_857]|nr:HCNGP-like protein-domain-containing protein [Bisporella sp. PMI_857]
MALVNYGSSDEEDLPQDEERAVAQNSSRTKTNGTNGIAKKLGNSSLDGIPLAKTESQSDAGIPAATYENLNTKPLGGPVLGPVMPTEGIADTPFPQVNEDGIMQSPYSAERTTVRDLTLPSLPNYNIPPSPPGSPVANTNAKFKHFMELKKQGVHFNEKLSKSAALKNPSLMQKLMDFADIDEVGEYSTTLSKDLWDPAVFPEAAYKEELAKSQKAILKKREDEKSREKRTALDFVPATSTADSSKNGSVRNGQLSASERIMAGLDRGRSNSPHVQGVKRKTRFES